MNTEIKKQQEEMLAKMHKAIDVLNKELAGLRTGRASINLLDPVTVEVYGSKMPISQVGTVSTPDAKTIAVQIWDKSTVQMAAKAITDANLGLNPMIDGQNIRITLPPLSEDRRKELVKIAHKYAENNKISIRNIRRDMMDFVKNMEKSKEISQDEMYKYSDVVQKHTDDFIKKIDIIVDVKEKEILTI